MELPELIRRIDELQARIIDAGPLSADAKRKLDYRFRLDWNYHSNVMEGSSLTQQETRSIMMGNVTVSGKPIKDVLEMQGHDELVTKLLGMAKGDINLSEARIREVHKAIVHEDDPAKKEQVGQWKKEGNYLHNYRGERFDFPPPNEVPEAMHQLLDRTKADIERIERGAKDAPHPALLAFRFHLDYVSIHPFHDGNGRTARIFGNLLLMRFGYPPVVIRVDEKETYNRYLAEVQAYGASADLFFTFIAERLVRAQELVIDAIEGRDLEEPDDLDKRLRLLELATPEADAEPLKRDAESITRVYAEVLKPMFRSFVDGIERLNTFFSEITYSTMVNGQGHEGQEYKDKLFDDIIAGLAQADDLNLYGESKNKGIRARDMQRMEFSARLQGFKRGTEASYSMFSDILVYFNEWTYTIVPNRSKQTIERPYRVLLSEAEVAAIVKGLREEAVNQLEERIRPKN